MSLYADFDPYNLPLGSDGTPWEYLEALRDEAVATSTPIGWSTAYGDDQFDGFWVCTRYAEGRELFRKSDSLSNRDVVWPNYGMPGQREPMMAGMDGERHAKYRKLVQRLFTPTAATEMTDHFQRDVNLLIDQFIDDGRADLVEVLSGKVPSRLTALMLGVQPEDGERYSGWVNAIAHLVHSDPGAAAAQAQEMQDHFQEVLRVKQANPGDDLFSRIVHMELDGRALTEDELLDYFTIILIGAVDTGESLLGSMGWRLAWDKELRRRLVKAPQLWEPAWDEMVRFYTPAYVFRLITKDFDIGGVEMKAGQHVTMVQPLMNRDPDVFEDPDIFKPDRSPNRHVTFGVGIHRCVGAHIARVEAQVTLYEFLRRIPEFELDPTCKPRWKQGQIMGMAGAVPIVFPPGGGSSTDWVAAQSAGFSSSSVG